MARCDWAGTDPLYIDYHDKEWGIPVYDGQHLFEFLLLEGMQAGLSWLTILRKREAFRKAFDDFDPHRIAKYTETKINKLLANSGIIRNRLKVLSAVTNAQACIRIQEEFGSFSKYIWDFTHFKVITNHWETMDEVPAETELSQKISKDLKKRGFKFVGPTIVYAHMQATGMVNDHLINCFRYSQCEKESHNLKI